MHGETALWNSLPSGVPNTGGFHELGGKLGKLWEGEVSCSTPSAPAPPRLQGSTKALPHNHLAPVLLHNPSPQALTGCVTQDGAP